MGKETPTQATSAVPKTVVDSLPELELPEEFKKLIAEHGEPFYRDGEGQVQQLGQRFWAGLNQDENVQLYEPNEREFYRYDPTSGLYVPISKDLLKREIADRLLLVSREMDLSSLERKRGNTTLSSIIDHLKGVAERRGAFIKTRNYIHLKNGMLVFKPGGEADLCEFSPSFFSRNQIPVAFDPDAKCDRFLNELVGPALSAEDALLLQKYFGLCLLGKNLPQRLLILEGQGGEGKSTLALVIQRIIGQVNVTELRTSHLAGRFELFRYQKKTLLTGVDVPSNFLNSKGASVIKGLVGGDWFDAEMKGGVASFQIQGNFCILVTANSRLHVKLNGDVKAWRRRLLILRFEGKPPARPIPDFEKLLVETEGPGILNWGIEGLRLMFADMHDLGGIALSIKQQNFVDALLAESDSVRHFLKATVIKEQGASLTSAELAEAYAEYCPSMGWIAKPITEVYRELEELMLELFRVAKSNSLPGFQGQARGFRNVTFNQDFRPL